LRSEWALSGGCPLDSLYNVIGVAATSAQFA
jgi:hypothetical protein